VTLKLASHSLCPFTLSQTDKRKGVTVVPSSAPIIEATAKERGMTLDETKVTTMLSKAPELCMRAVVIHPAKTALVVSLIRSMIFSASVVPIMVAEDLIKQIADMKKYSAPREPNAFLRLSVNFLERERCIYKNIIYIGYIVYIDHLV